MFGLSIIQLVLAGVATAAVVGGGWAITNHFENNGERKIEAKYAPMLAVCPDEAKFFGGTKKASPEDCAAYMKKAVAAIEANVHLTAEYEKVKTAGEECSTKVAVLERRGKIMSDLLAARKPKEDAKVAVIEAEKMELIEMLNVADKVLTCEQRMARRDAMWKKIAAERERDFPPTKGAKPPSSDVMIRGPSK